MALPDANKETLRNGWFHPGDIGICDSDGCYFIVDRRKDMILLGGFKVYPRDVEAAVIGIVHESHGDPLKAVVALKAGQTSSADEMTGFCKERFAAIRGRS